jgi:hypothetical protein
VSATTPSAVPHGSSMATTARCVTSSGHAPIRSSGWTIHCPSSSGAYRAVRSGAFSPVLSSGMAIARVFASSSLAATPSSSGRLLATAVDGGSTLYSWPNLSMLTLPLCIYARRGALAACWQQ